MEIDIADAPNDGDGNLLLTGSDHAEVLCHPQESISGVSKDDVLNEIAELFLCHYDVSKWDWSRNKPFNRHLAEDYIERLKHTGTRRAGIDIFCLRALEFVTQTHEIVN